MSMFSRLIVAVCALAPLCLADLRMASQPKPGGRNKEQFKVIHQSRRRQIPFNTTHALYMEPSAFAYHGLRKQRDGGGYDNFLRSNIDNEQDKRDFIYEFGRDHLPFRSWETASTDVHEEVRYKIPGGYPGTNITVTPGEAFLVPLRWNNPHSSELEVNVWIVQNKYVVPIRKPTCSGEGYQDNAFSFTVPTDFNDLAHMAPGFEGCTEVGDCVLQIYAHSVESRTYAIGSPLIVTGYTGELTGGKPKATDEDRVQPAGVDVGMDLTKLPRPLCRSSYDPDADIKAAVPRKARLISDQYNHAYQNSDYSPYSGQQPEEISKNMQASCILKMVPGNRGELGKQALLKDNRQGFNFQRSLDRKAKQLVKAYEKIANSLINVIGGKIYVKEDQLQNLANHEGEKGRTQDIQPCFRCAEVGATSSKRLETETYIPSFVIPKEFLGAVKLLMSEEYMKVIEDQSDGSGLVQIYVTAVNDLMEEFKKAAELNITYQGPMIKTTLATMEDTTKFRKRDADNNHDNGLYAAREAYKKHGGPPWREAPPETDPTAGQPLPEVTPSALRRHLNQFVSYGTNLPLPDTAAPGKTMYVVPDGTDMHGVMADADCEDPWNEETDTMECTEPTEQLFDLPADIEAEMQAASNKKDDAVVSSAFPREQGFCLASLSVAFFIVYTFQL